MINKGGSLMERGRTKKAIANPARRKFLKILGAGAATTWAGGTFGIRYAGSAQPPDVARPESFGRMFRLPPFAPPTNAVRQALSELGKAGGIALWMRETTSAPVRSD